MKLTFNSITNCYSIISKSFGKTRKPFCTISAKALFAPIPLSVSNDNVMSELIDRLRSRYKSYYSGEDRLPISKSDYLKLNQLDQLDFKLIDRIGKNKKIYKLKYYDPEEKTYGVMEFKSLSELNKWKVFNESKRSSGDYLEIIEES